MGIASTYNFTKTQESDQYLQTETVLRQKVGAFLGGDTRFKLNADFLGIPGEKGWAPVFGLEVNSTNVFLKLVNWSGGEGNKPDIPSNVYIGTNGFTNLAGAINVKGVQGAKGDTGNTGNNGNNGADAKYVTTIAISGGNIIFTFNDGSNISVPFTAPSGDNGWSPLFVTEIVSGKSTIKITDWIGGEGTKPTIPSSPYIGPTGFTNAAGATDFKGATGATGLTGVKGDDGDPGPTGPQGPAGSIAVYELRDTDDLDVLIQSREYFTLANEVVNNGVPSSVGKTFYSIRAFGNDVIQTATTVGARVFMRKTNDAGLNWSAWSPILN
jgi:hypothetical protein